MALPFAIYCRASEGADGALSSPLEEQEAYGRDWAARNGIEVADVVSEVASGALAADDRKLGQLIQRCEKGELAGIIVRDEKRFARDIVAGGAALARLTDCGARLVATWTGFDSENLTPEGLMVFNMLLSVGQAERERNRLRRMRGKEKAAEAGVYCAPMPTGYDRDDEGRLVPNADAEKVREVFRRRAAGEGFSDIARGVGLTRAGARKVVMNRAYLGEQRIPIKERKGEPRVIRNSHPPLVTEAEWQAANGVRGRAPRHTGLAATTQLKGVVRCGVCGGTMHVLSYGKDRSRRTYACTNRGCCGMTVESVERAALWQLQLAIFEREPHVAAVIEGDTRYADALEAVTRAEEALASYRDDVEMQQLLGVTDFKEGLRVRKEAVLTARRALREVPAPQPMTGREKLTLEEFDLADRRRFYARAIAEVLVFPRATGERLRMRWTGAEETFIVPPVPRPDPSGIPVAT
jgi:DNA invertase Pin-like site-specific DNA recombinase